MSSLNELKNVYNESAKVQVLTAQVKMLTELIVIATQPGDVRTELKKYIDNKEKELGI